MGDLKSAPPSSPPFPQGGPNLTSRASPGKPCPRTTPPQRSFVSTWQTSKPAAPSSPRPSGEYRLSPGASPAASSGNVVPGGLPPQRSFVSTWQTSKPAAPSSPRPSGKYRL